MGAVFPLGCVFLGRQRSNWMAFEQELASA